MDIPVPSPYALASHGDRHGDPLRQGSAASREVPSASAWATVAVGLGLAVAVRRGARR